MMLLSSPDGDINVVWRKGKLGESRLCKVAITLVEDLAAMGVHLHEPDVATKLGPTKRRMGRSRKNSEKSKVSSSNLDFNLSSKLLNIVPNEVAHYVGKIGMNLGVSDVADESVMIERLTDVEKRD
ncbi:methionine ABC transporter ATP-binding protein [Sesbania bispinosa]|nr:methionine ABC transporter ATP-binding protein [Sesbania bispinosa]